MNFYKRNIGDYRKKTARLSPLEVGVYDLLLDEIYATEEPLPLDEGELFNIVGARTEADEAAVRKVLARYFERSDVGWTNERASEEIAAAQAQARTNRRIAHEREAKRSAAPHEPSNEPCNASSTNARSRETPDSRLQKEDSPPSPPPSDGSRKTLPPDDFAPTEPTLNHGRERGLSDGHIHEAAVAYRNWCIANDKRRTERGHQAGLKNWLAKDAEDARGSPQGPRNGHGRRTQREIKHDLALAAREIVDEERRGGALGGEAPAFDA